MTEIKVIRNRTYENLIETISINGHSGYAPEGQDIVCASISSVSYYLGVLLNELGYEFSIIEDEVFFQLTIDDMSAETEDIFKAFLKYANELKEQYPDNVKIVETLVD